MVRLHLSSDIPDLATIERRSLLLLLNQNPGVDFTELVPPNIISVGGLHVTDPNPIPIKLDEFIQSSKKGTVVMWLGANYGSNVMPETTQRMFVDAFKSLPDYHFLWKFDSDSIEGYSTLPKNVRIRPRMVMNDILAHPKVVGFITHCGLLSIHEATINGMLYLRTSDSLLCIDHQ
jgi:glucuronosyltransferase